MADIMASVQVVQEEPGKTLLANKEASQEPYPTFGPHPNTKVADFNFKKEVECLPFKLNLGGVPSEKNTRPNLLT